jgi:NADH:ubiquinone oxidoreductase subunit F (NADH-binding)/(2Fe-2S) ferredoxin/Fe-S-cluster-containing hydrogenase component 2
MAIKTNKRTIDSPEVLKERAKELEKELENKIIISICSGTGCKALSSDNLFDALKKEIGKRNKEEIKKIVLKKTGCHGYCERGPIIVIQPQGVCYLGVSEKDIPEVVEKTLNGKVITSLLYNDDEGNTIKNESEIPFYKYQQRIILSNNSKIDPESIEDYIRVGGYQALAKALKEMTPDEILNEVKKSNLRGRGGGGFPAGIKWETTRNTPSDQKYVVVNADEGDPGAYMDRSLLEGNPHGVLEGLIIGAYTIGASRGYVYVRQEYPQAVKNIKTAIEQAREYGFLGNNIFGSGFDFDVMVHRGAGAFVSGESSALMAAIEGNVGEPRLKYTRTAVSGLWGKPTNLNNVETWANVPYIIKNGSEWFTSVGTRKSPGTKIFSLVGKVNNTGLVEVPMGISLRDIIFKIGGGIKNGRKFKAVQTGGPSGGVLPDDLIDLPVDFDELDKAGSMMGSGGMIVMDESDCMVNVAHYFLKFLADESCGKCVPCREGLRQMLYIYERIMSGKGKEEDLKLLGDLSIMMKEASMCALGTTAPNIVLTTLKYFKEEYESHIYYNMCPAKVCKPLVTYIIEKEKCAGCGSCAKACPVNAIEGELKKPYKINTDICIKCGSCIEACPSKYNAIVKKTGIAEKVKAEKKEVKDGLEVT